MKTSNTGSRNRGDNEGRGTYLSYLRNLIFDEHVFIQLKERGRSHGSIFIKELARIPPAKPSPS